MKITTVLLALVCILGTADYALSQLASCSGDFMNPGKACLRCQSYCGNGKCDYPRETCSTCPQDCGVCLTCEARCGNGLCERNETACSCPEDCGVCCEDNFCNAEKGENFFNCAKDCAVDFGGIVVDFQTRALLTQSIVTCSIGSTTLGPIVALTGSFSFSRVRSGFYTCTASSRNYDSNTISFSVSLESKLSNSNTTSVVIPLGYQNATIVGRVYDAITFQGLHAATTNCRAQSLNISTGMYSTTPNGDFFYSNVIPDTYNCSGSAFGYKDSSATGVVPSGGHQEFKIYLLPLPGRISGRATTALGGLPIQSVTVVCRSQTSTATNTSVLTFTKITGNYSLEGIDAGVATCTASKTGYITQQGSGIVPRGGLLIIDFVMTEIPSFLVGTVNDSFTLLPIHESNVNCTYLPAPQLNLTTIPTASDTTIANGNYSVNPISAGSWRCRASKEGWDPRTSQIYVPAASRTVLPFLLDPLPAMIFGTVTTRVGGVQFVVKGATVSCVFTTQPNVQADLGPQNTNSSGDFAFQNIMFASTAVELTFTCRGNRAGFGNGTKTGVIRRGQAVRADIELLLLAINVQVVDRNSGDPIPSATVQCVAPLANQTLGGLSSTDGRISFNAVTPGEYVCNATKNAYTVDQITGITVNALTGAVSIVLRIEIKRYLLQGRVISDISKNPIAGASVNIFNGTILSSIGRPPLFTLTTNATGGFSFLTVLPMQVAMIATFGDLYLQGNFQFNVDETPASFGRIFTLALLPASSIIQGTITSSGINPVTIAGVKLNLVPLGGGTEGNTISSSTGAYQFNNLVATTYSLFATLEGYADLRINIVVPELGVIVPQDLVMVPLTTGAVSGVVRGSSGGVISLLAGATVVIFNPVSGQRVTLVTNSTGSYSFPTVSFGNVVITASAEGYNPANQTIAVGRGSNVQVPDFFLGRKSGIISGVVYATNPRALALSVDNVNICLYPEGFANPDTSPACSNSNQKTFVGAGSTYSIRDLPEGQYFLIAVSSAGALRTTRVDGIIISQDSPLTLDVNMLRA